mmetsp:Transcript_4748/g.14531  ORF Transcript_4748/g.14531 Transcript_4748/m.14531 type:complete len:159 (-) Transcript_4748:1119-1595(-)
MEAVSTPSITGTRTATRPGESRTVGGHPAAPGEDDEQDHADGEAEDGHLSAGRVCVKGRRVEREICLHSSCAPMRRPVGRMRGSPGQLACMVAGWRLSSVNHTGWLSSRGADDAAEARRAEEAGSWEWEGSDQVAIEAVMVLIDAETITHRRRWTRSR